jgi:hypothetical protein
MYTNIHSDWAEVENMKKTMEELREELHIMLDSNECNYKRIVNMSQELEKLITDYYNSKLLN